MECIYFPITEVVCWIQVAPKITCRKLITPERSQLGFHSKLTGSEKVAIHSTNIDLERTQTPRETSYRRQVTPTNQLFPPIFLKPAPFQLFHKYTRKMCTSDIDPENWLNPPPNLVLSELTNRKLFHSNIGSVWATVWIPQGPDPENILRISWEHRT